MPASDIEMADAPANSSIIPDSQVNNEIEYTEAISLYDGYNPSKKQIRKIDIGSDTAATFEFTNEDHTLGNALRWIIMKNPDVEFCGYSIPHPAEPKMNLRIQLYEDGNVSVFDVLEKGLQNLQDACEVIGNKFKAARTEHAKSPGKTSSTTSETISSS